MIVKTALFTETIFSLEFLLTVELSVNPTTEVTTQHATRSSKCKGKPVISK